MKLGKGTPTPFLNLNPLLKNPGSTPEYPVFTVVREQPFDFMRRAPILSFLFETVREKTKNLGSDQVRHNLGCTVIEDG